MNARREDAGPSVHRRGTSPELRRISDAYAGGVRRVEGMDHIVLVVGDVERSVAWYRDRLGLEVLRLDEWKDGKAPFPSVRVNEGTIIDILAGTRTGTNVDHLCLVLAPTDLAELAASDEFDVLDGPVSRWGARGEGTSVYVRDPDGNVVELRHYGESSC
jgi:catechol 2,3-dioxygenase-like lactoylglutathione lyase family enzyme